MAKVRESLRSGRNVLERLAARVPGFRGYQGREERREADKILREYGASRLERIVTAIQETIAKSSLEEITEYQELVTQVEKLCAELRFADRGYSGFFDERKLDGDAALDAVYAQDERIVAQVEEIAAQVSDADLSAASLRGSVKRLGLALADRRNAILGLGSH
jgi:chromosome segregation ATPase